MDQTVKAHITDVLTRTLTPLRAYLDDPQVEEIMINGPDDVWIERAGQMFQLEIKLPSVTVEMAIHALAKLAGKDARAGTSDGLINARMEGFRIAAAMSPTATNGHSMCIRKHNPVDLTLADYVASGFMDRATRELCEQLIRAKKNVIVAGGTSSGKTTFLNALIATMDVNDRLVTLEDTRELKVRSNNRVCLESNEQAGISIRDLVALSLRYRPDRIIVGEVRGGEAFDLMQAANTGHEGFLVTVHANSAAAALTRLETLVLTSGVEWPHAAIRQSIAESFSHVIYFARRHGKRRLEQIMEIRGYDTRTDQYLIEHIFKLEEPQGPIQPTM